MSETQGDRISPDAKIIVGVEDSEATGWHSLHLHTSLYAISVRPDQQVVVVAEGSGRGRLRHMRIPFKNIFRFEAVEVPIGHNCLAGPVDVDQLGERHLIPEDKPFAPVMVRLLIKHSTKPDFVSIHDVGATPLPILVPLLSKLPESGLAKANIKLRSANDCFILAREVGEWVVRVNARIKGEGPAREESASQELQRIYTGLDRTKPDVVQTLVSAYAAIYISIRLLKALRMRKPVKILSCFPLNRTSEDVANQPPHYSTIEALFAVGERYQTETGRPADEAFAAICEHLKDLEERNVTIDSSEKLEFLKNNAPRPINIIEPEKKIGERGHVLDGSELRHAQQLRQVFENEGVSIHYLEGLPFLSLLVQYDDENGQTCHAVLIKEETHPALKDFLLSHEMGHLFLHIYRDFYRGVNARSEKVDRFLRSSADEDTFLEHEASDFGMAVLFPPAYLADRPMFKGELSTEGLLDEFLQGMEEGVTQKLKEQMRRRIDEHIKKYKKFKDDKAPSVLRLEVRRIEEKNLEGLLTLIDNTPETFYWLRLDKESQIVRASDNSVHLFGRPIEEIVGASPLKLVVPEEVERMRQRAKYRAEHKEAICYFTWVINKERGTSRQVIVYSFPILRGDEYAGAMAALKPLDEMETESFPL